MKKLYKYLLLAVISAACQPWHNSAMGQAETKHKQAGSGTAMGLIARRTPAGNRAPSLINFPRLGTLQPKHSSEITNSYWGIQISALADSTLQKAGELGVHWTRLHAHWEDIETEKGVYDWQETDEAFDAVLKYGITPFVTIGNGNSLYSGTGNYDDPKLAAIYGESPAPPVGSEIEMEAWLTFVEAVIERYKDKIQYWEIWNEPNHRKYWGAVPNGEDYGRLVKVTADKIRAMQPDAKIVAGSMAGIDPEFTDAFLSQCNPQNIDIISFHNYAALPEDRAYSMPGFLEVIDKHNPSLGIWQGECGYPSQSRTTGFRGRAPWGLNIQAKWLLRQSFVDTYFCRATLSNYFLLDHHATMSPEPRSTELTGIDSLFGFPERGGSRLYSDGVNQKCILFRKDQKPKPAFHAYQNLCAAMDARYKVHMVAHKLTVNNEGVFYGISEDDAFPSVPLVASFKNDEDNHLIAYWLPWNAQENLSELAQIKLALEQVSFQKPVLLNPLDGSVYEIEGFEQQSDGVSFENLPLGDFPLIIMERKEVNL